MHIDIYIHRLVARTLLCSLGIETTGERCHYHLQKNQAPKSAIWAVAAAARALVGVPGHEDVVQFVQIRHYLENTVLSIYCKF